MNNKQLAEMIKHLRKIKMEQKLVGSGGSYVGAGADIQDPASPNRRPGSATKEIHHGVVEEDELNEFQTRSMVGSHVYKATLGKTETRTSAIKTRSRPLGTRQKTRYSLEEKQANSNTKSIIINTTPEQDSAMVGTQ
jgi:hypothetical protein